MHWAIKTNPNYHIMNKYTNEFGLNIYIEHWKPLTVHKPSGKNSLKGFWIPEITAFWEKILCKQKNEFSFELMRIYSINYFWIN